MRDDFEYQKEKASSWFLTLREEIIKSFEYIEDIYLLEQASEKPVGRFTVKRTKRGTTLKSDGGGGIMAIMRGGNVFEKVGVNVSTVYGPLDARITKLMKTRKSFIAL